MLAALVAFSFSRMGLIQLHALICILILQNKPMVPFCSVYPESSSLGTMKQARLKTTYCRKVLTHTKVERIVQYTPNKPIATSIMINPQSVLFRLYLPANSQPLLGESFAVTLKQTVSVYVLQLYLLKTRILFKNSFITHRPKCNDSLTSSANQPHNLDCFLYVFFLQFVGLKVEIRLMHCNWSYSLRYLSFFERCLYKRPTEIPTVQILLDGC